MTLALIFAGGESPGLTQAQLPIPDLIIAADSGLHHALDIEITPHLVIGDLDSADPGRVEQALCLGADVDRHRADKDQTDLELAMGTAVERGADELVIVGGLGGRLDHLLANCSLLAADRWAAQQVSLIAGSAQLWVVRGERRLDLDHDATVTLLAYGGPATVTTTGMRWDLTDADLAPGSSWGVSNEVTASDGPTVTADPGVVVAVAAR